MKNGLGQLPQQFLAIWKQLGLNQRVSLILAAGVVLFGMGGLAFWSSRTDYALLYGRLDEAEAAKVVASLDEAKVPYKVSRGGGTISVPADKVHVLRMQLAAKGIPRGEGIGFEIFDKPNFGLSDFVQRANYLRAVQGELARTIAQVDSIESARVMVVIPENRLLLDNQKKPTASVFVRVRGNGALPPQTVEAIRFLVANAVEGLTAANVSVVDNQGNVLSENHENDSVAGLSATQLTARKNFEQYLARKAEGMLEKVLGPGQAVARVAAEINFDTLSRTEEKFDPDSSVVRISNINDENVESTTPAGGGVAGAAVDANTDTNVTATASTSQVNNRTRKKVTNNQYEINKIVSNVMQTPGGIKRLSAAVFVATRFSISGTNRVVMPRTPDEMQKLRRIVQSALGIQENDALRRDEITIEEMPFNEQPALELTQRLDTEQRRLFWWEIGKNVAYPFLALVVILFFWRLFRQTPSTDIPLGVPLQEFSGATSGAGGQGANAPARTRMHPPGVVTVDVLNQLIRENPNNMTQAIRSWMQRGNN